VFDKRSARSRFTQCHDGGTLNAKTEASINQLAGDVHWLTAPFRFLFRCLLALVFLLLAPLLYATIPFICIAADPNSDFSILAFLYMAFAPFASSFWLLMVWAMPQVYRAQKEGRVFEANHVKGFGLPRRSPALASQLRGRLTEIPGVQVLDRGKQLAAIVTCTIDGWQAQPLKQAMDARGINSSLSFREVALYDFGDKNVDWCLRLSPHYYNTGDEVETVVGAITELARRNG
jgi:hypothetical protein